MEIRADNVTERKASTEVHSDSKVLQAQILELQDEMKQKSDALVALRNEVAVSLFHVGNNHGVEVLLQVHLESNATAEKQLKQQLASSQTETRQLREVVRIYCQAVMQ